MPTTVPPQTDVALDPAVAALLVSDLADVRCGELDEALRRTGVEVIAGVDEAGRGPLAGPLVAAAVIIGEHVDLARDLPGLDDSKKLTEAARERLLPLIEEHCEVAVVVASSSDIDRDGINPCNHGAMLAAVAQLGTAADLALIDGYALDDVVRADGSVVSTLQVVKGDRRSAAIAAASVVAKVTRDRTMVRLDVEHPGYGFAGHKGYGTKAHLAAIEQLGPCAAHRMSFKPLSQMSDGQRRVA